MNDIVVASRPDVKGYVRMNRFLLTWEWVFWAVPLVIFGLGIFLHWFTEGESGIGFIVVSPAVMGVMLLINWLSTLWLMKSSKFYTDLQLQVFTFNEQGLNYKTPQAELLTKWEDIHRVYETNQGYYILPDSTQAYILEKSYVTQEQADEIEKYLSKLNAKVFKSSVKSNRPQPYGEKVIDLDVTHSEVPDSSSFEIQIDTHLTQEDFVKFNEFELFRGVFNKVFFALVPIVFLVISILDFLDGDAIGGVIFGMFAVIFIPALWIITRVVAKRTFKTNKELVRSSEVSFGFTNAGLTEVTQESKAFFPWDQLLWVYENKDYVFVYVSKMQAFILRKEDIDPSTLTRLKELMSNHLTQKQKRYQ